MPSSMNWVDGAAGGTPVSAANLNKLAVVADVGTAGTPTGDALRAAYGALTGANTWTGAQDFTGATVSGIGGTTDATNPASYGTVDLTGATGSAAAIQAAFDAGQKKIQLRNGIYLIDAPVFLDADTDATSGPYVIEGAGSSVLKLKGSALPTISTHTADSAVWGFHVNQNRSYLSGGVVTYVADNAHRATGGGFPAKPRLIVRNCVIDSDTALAGFAYGNTAAIRFENCTLKTLKYGFSWTGYTDGTSVSQCETMTMASGGWLILQITNGDGILIDGVKGHPGAGIWSATNCHGGTVRGAIQGGFSFSNCSGITIDNPHAELGGSGAALAHYITCKNSQVVIDGAYVYSGSGAGQNFLYVDDSATDLTTASDVTLRNFHPNYFYNSGDQARQPDIYINAATTSFKLRVEGIQAQTARSSSSFEFNPDGVMVASAISGITTAITNARAIVASGNWVLRQVNGAWEIGTVSPLNGLVVTRTLQAPSFASSPGPSSSVSGTLTNGTNYEYAMACRDYAGHYSPVSAASTLVAPTAGALIWQTTVPTSPCTLVVWRKAGGTAGQVLTAPDAYVEIPLDGARTKTFDTGTLCSGRPWVTTSVPVPNTVAAVNGTADGFLFADGTFLSKTTLASGGAASQRIASNLSTVSVVNTVTETDLARLTIPAGQPAVNDRYILVAYGDTLNNSGANVTYTFKAYMGATAILTAGALSLSTNGSRRFWELRLEVDMVSTTAQDFMGRLTGFGGPAGTSWNPVSTTGMFLGTGTQAQDTSTSKDLALTVTLGTAVATADARCLSAYLQRIAA